MKPLFYGLIAMLVEATPLWAHPYMIRLGYSTCVACHVSPQGGGLLTTYGQGVEGAMSLRVREYKQTGELEKQQEEPRVLYDARALPVGSWTNGVSDSSVQVLLLSSLQVGAHQHLTSSMTFATPTLPAPLRSGEADRLAVPTLVWEYRPVNGFELMVGRDALPTGLGSPDPQAFIRVGTDPGATPYPTQVKAFWWTRRWQVTPYAFGPSGEEAAAAREWGGGALVGVTGWNQRAVIGVSAEERGGFTFTRRSVGAYARLGLAEKWAVLAEHELITRATGLTGLTTGYVAGHTRLIFVPYEWLETWVSTDELVTHTSTSSAYTVRVTPGMLLRVSPNLQAGFTTRDVVTVKGISRNYSVTLTVKIFN